MGKIDGLILKIALGAFAATNCVACIFTTAAEVLVPLNLLVALACIALFLFVRSIVAGIARDLGISRGEAGRVVGSYFSYYRNVERVSLDEYLRRTARA